MNKAARTTFTAIALITLSACASTPGAPSTYFANQKIPAPSQTQFPHCYNYGCAKIVSVDFSAQDWQEIDTLFTPSAQNAATERAQISKAIGRFEHIVGAKTGTEVDGFGTFKNSGQFHHDCVDESTNTTVYLTLLEERGLMTHHIAGAPDSRIPFIHGGTWPHRTAVIHEKGSGNIYAVDSWFHDNGFPAEIVPHDIWKKGWKAPKNLTNADD